MVLFVLGLLLCESVTQHLHAFVPFTTVFLMPAASLACVRLVCVQLRLLVSLGRGVRSTGFRLRMFDICEHLLGNARPHFYSPHASPSVPGPFPMRGMPSKGHMLRQSLNASLTLGTTSH
ncbi:hypothetical protein BDY17DRAFT_200592 [Neohortaea acidophila]|uniref:Secreted protein n=1 Tax=Neohortaea acidophila TaxID=245834 RepID=A0A6A6PN04_9PEZI|nr:uncharacterized protein BDY17DRAFT_200592 [Neohortaea acidophila]KAF2480813.1 hypothetical protein BDY17DRAFT_200592 [Neohortaea acidophila]